MGSLWIPKGGGKFSLGTCEDRRFQTGNKVAFGVTGGERERQSLSFSIERVGFGGGGGGLGWKGSERGLGGGTGC